MFRRRYTTILDHRTLIDLRPNDAKDKMCQLPNSLGHPLFRFFLLKLSILIKNSIPLVQLLHVTLETSHRSPDMIS